MANIGSVTIIDDTYGQEITVGCLADDDDNGNETGRQPFIRIDGNHGECLVLTLEAAQKVQAALAALLT